MKKLIYLLFLLPLVFNASCSSDDDDKDVAKTESIEVKIKVGEDYNLPKGTYTIETASESFVAETSKDGKIKGNHDGLTSAKLKSGNTTYDCKITVSANTTFFVDMKYLLGQKKSAILEIYGEPTSIKGKTHYFKSKTFEKQNIFLFDDKEIVTTAAIVFASSHAAKLDKHLTDRYKTLSSVGNKLTYIDGNSLDNYKVAVIAEVTSTEISLFYIPKEVIDQGSEKSIKSLF